jgi:hypothetical protein
MVPMYILSLLLGFARLTDKQWYKRMAKAGRKATQRGANYLPAHFRPNAIAFAKRLFGGRKSD